MSAILFFVLKCVLGTVAVAYVGLTVFAALMKVVDWFRRI